MYIRVVLSIPNVVFDGVVGVVVPPVPVGATYPHVGEFDST
jgi:hypothetical protein